MKNPEKVNSLRIICFIAECFRNVFTVPVSLNFSNIGFVRR